MLHINDLSYRIEGRLLLDHATVAIPARHKVGLVGRNGSGKSTLLHLILGRLNSETGSVSLPKSARIGTVAQEAPAGESSLLDTVLAADEERSRLMAEAETASDAGRIADIQTRLVDIDAHSAPARAASILAGLGFSESDQAGSCAALSGGWRMRVALAAALFAKPDVLLLDEPTNYLDLEGVIWLKNYLRKYPFTVIIVSHDRDLLNEAVDAILHLSERKLTIYQGNYDNFDSQRREKQALQLKLKKKQEDQRRHMEAFVERFRYKASKAKQAQSRLKALDKLQPIADVVSERVAAFVFPAAEKPLNPPLIRFEGAAAGYGGQPVLRDINLRIDGDDRIALLGANGNGKSTFAKLICGRLQVMAGMMKHHKKLQVAYFAQHQLDELHADWTPYDYAVRLMPEATIAQRRAKLGVYGFGVEHAGTKTSALSGGEKARLLFAIAAFNGAHVLILDEPTNHLDVEAREALIHALNDFDGAIILISHDRHLIETCADRLWLVNNGTVAPYDGDMTSYTQLVLDQARMARRKTKQISSAEKPPPARKASRTNIVPLKKKIEETDRRIIELHEKVAVLDKALANSTIYSQDPNKAKEFVRLRAKLSDQLEAAETIWLSLNEELESLTA